MRPIKNQIIKKPTFLIRNNKKNFISFLLNVKPYNVNTV